MSNSPTSVGFRNPDTYLNHLSPKQAIEYEISRNILLILLGATLWDIIIYIPEDIRVVKRSRFRSVIFCFIFSRLFAAAYVFSNVIRRTTPIDNLYVATQISAVVLTLSIWCSSYLFLQRIWAIYADSPRARRFFFFFWLIYALSEILVFVGIKPTYIPETRYFQDSGVQPVTALAIVIAIIYDSFVFLAISYKIAFAHVIVERKAGWTATFISGRALPRLARAVLHGGQQYYLLNVVVLTPIGILIYLPFTPQIVKSMLTVFLAPLMASMSCRVYRNIKLFDHDLSLSYPVSEIQFL